jgi:hypothetical protein
MHCRRQRKQQWYVFQCELLLHSENLNGNQHQNGKIISEMARQKRKIIRENYKNHSQKP